MYVDFWVIFIPLILYSCLHYHLCDIESSILIPFRNFPNIFARVRIVLLHLYLCNLIFKIYILTKNVVSVYNWHARYHLEWTNYINKTFKFKKIHFNVVEFFTSTDASHSKHDNCMIACVLYFKVLDIHNTNIQLKLSCKISQILHS